MSTQQQLYSVGDDGSCQCPIHRGGDPHTLPLGVGFADRVSVEPIAQSVAKAVYEAHHSYMPSVPDVNICHHGLYFDDDLVGAITYRQPLLHRLKLYEHPAGEHVYTRDSSVGTDPFMINGGDVVEVARICIGTEMANLASCTFAASMERFVADHADRLGVEWLLTFVRNDHSGSMIKALCDKGWQLVGLTEPRQAGNRPDREIREWRKQRWLCDLESASITEMRGRG